MSLRFVRRLPQRVLGSFRKTQVGEISSRFLSCAVKFFNFALAKCRALFVNYDLDYLTAKVVVYIKIK